MLRYGVLQGVKYKGGDVVSKRKLSILLLIIILVTTLSGCIQAEVGIKLNKDGSGIVNIMMAQNTDMLSEEERVELLDFSEGTNTVEGANVKTEQLKYTYDGSNFEGERIILEIDDLYTYLKEAQLNEGDDIKIAVQPNGNTRLEIYSEGINNEGSDEIEGIGELDMYQLLKMTGAKFEYSIEVEHDVIDHNATKVVGNVYVWDMIELSSTGDPENGKWYMYVEFKDDSAIYESTREVLEKKWGFAKDDLDFHGKVLNELGILRGTDKGLELDKGLTRAEGAVMYARLLGIEEMIQELSKNNNINKHPFSDVPNWVEPYISYLYNEGLIKGVSSSKYGSDQQMTETQYATLVLRAMGYIEGSDFSWDNAYLKMREVGMYKEDAQASDVVLVGTFNRRQMAYMSYNALFYKNLNGETLLDRLINSTNY